ncbi:hypothetical protein FC72_GL000163 [Companilactobacillus tucceti DSM 20183]|uniref:Uncharacterized protein n=1 Tax=Companilactobacillus tucceti DSM 20183 TaxID=1423811 RepID=A0A0R1JF05_9LACO|nr:hypothetical protein [Companilactobacillus tucceti]KRK65719.1 hypothetical protein FC72_GL000163 [Companilactobacillus tucceti DSM 20183]
MTINVTMEESIYQLLKDVDRNYFTSNRQLNKTSMLYKTVEEVQNSDWFENLKIEAIENYSLATVTLKNATLTDEGLKKLQELKVKYDTNEEDK